MAFSLARRDDAEDVAFNAAAMADHQQSQAAAQAKENKSVLFFRVIWIINELANFVCEHGLSIFEAHARFCTFTAAFFGSHSNRSMFAMYALRTYDARRMRSVAFAA